MMQRGWSTHNISWSTQPAAQQISNYELFNCNNFNIRYRSWNYRGCWHQTCPELDSRQIIYYCPITINHIVAVVTFSHLFR